LGALVKVEVISAKPNASSVRREAKNTHKMLMASLLVTQKFRNLFSGINENSTEKNKSV
jgi:hypothetical protein